MGTTLDLEMFIFHTETSILGSTCTLKGSVCLKALKPFFFWLKTWPSVLSLINVLFPPFHFPYSKEKKPLLTSQVFEIGVPFS